MFFLRMGFKMALTLLAMTVAGLAILAATGSRLSYPILAVPLMSFAMHLFLRWKTVGFYKNTAAQTGLERSAESSYPRVIEGSLEGFAVSVDESHQDKFTICRITVDSRLRKEGSVPPGLRLMDESSAGFMESLKASLNAGHRAVGDEGFDSKIFIDTREGPLTIPLALLDAGLRAHIMELLQDLRLKVEDGSVVLEVWAKPGHPSSLAEAVDRAVELAKKLILSDGDIPFRLARNARKDPMVSVRRRSFSMLAANFPGHPATLETAQSLLDDNNPEMRFQAARIVGEEGFGTLKGLVYPSVSRDEIAARALAHLARHFSSDRVMPLVMHSLRSADESLQKAALWALRSFGESSAEGEAVAFLSSDSKDLRNAAVQALARTGTAASVAPLRALADSRPLDYGLRTAVKEAIDEIKARLEGAGAGQITLTEAEEAAGKVSLAEEDERGRLDLPLQVSDNDGQESH